jgi:phage protein D
MYHPRFQIRIGATVLDSRVSADLNTVEEIQVELEINGIPNRFCVTVGAVGDSQVAKGGISAGLSPPGPPGLNIRPGDSIEADLGYDDELTRVFTGEVDQVIAGIEQQVIKCSDSARRLVTLHINQTFEQQTAGDIAAGLAGEAKVDVAQKDAGVELPLFVIDETKNGFEHIRELAEKNGFDFYLNAQGKLVFKKPSMGSAARTFRYGADILEVDVFQQDVPYQKVEVRGESPASSLGIEKAHWLVKTFDDSLGTAGSGQSVLNVQDPAVKTKAAADAMAAGILERITAKAVRGYLKALGAQDVMLGDVIAVADHFDDIVNGTYQVWSIRHHFSKSRGFVSRFMINRSGEFAAGPAI